MRRGMSDVGAYQRLNPSATQKRGDVGTLVTDQPSETHGVSLCNSLREGDAP
jgi:hypothetical protein